MSDEKTRPSDDDARNLLSSGLDLAGRLDRVGHYGDAHLVCALVAHVRERLPEAAPEPGPAAAAPAPAAARHRHAWKDGACTVAGCDAKPRPRKPRAQTTIPGTGAALVLVAALAAAAGASGCAPVQTPEGPILVVTREAAAEAFANAIAARTGFKPAAVTLPLTCVPPIFLSREAAADPCVRRHEATHVEQRSAEQIEDLAESYWRQFIGCWQTASYRTEAIDGCYRGVSYEVDAYAAEAECRRAGAGGSP